MRRPFGSLSARSRGVLVLATVLSLGGLAFSAGAASAAPAASVTAPPYSCAPNGPAGSQTVYGTFGDASVIGWAGNSQGVVACLGGSFWVDTSGPDGGPGSASTAAVTGTTYGYGIYDDSSTTWTNADGYLPALVTGFHRDGAAISITNFGDDVTIGGHAYVVIYSRVQVTNPTGQTISVDPQPSAGLVPLNSAPVAVPPHSTVDHDYAVASDRFGGSYAWPSAGALAAAGGYDQHFAHMRAYWDSQLAGIAQIQALPDPSLVNAYKTGFIYTQIIRSGDELKTGANGYDKEFSHDVIGILANLFTQGYTGGAHGLLDRARYVIGSQTQYDDGVLDLSLGLGHLPAEDRRPELREGQLRHRRPRRYVRAQHLRHRPPDRHRPHRARRDHGGNQRHRRKRLLDHRQLRGTDGPVGLPLARSAGR